MIYSGFVKDKTAFIFEKLRDLPFEKSSKLEVYLLVDIGFDCFEYVFDIIKTEHNNLKDLMCMVVFEKTNKVVQSWAQKQLRQYIIE